MIKAAIFDVGGVLTTTILNYMAEDLAKKHKMDEGLVFRTLHSKWNLYKVAEIGADEFWQAFIDEAKVDETADNLKKMSLGYIKAKKEAFNVAKSLQGKYKLAIISNNADEWVVKERKIVDFSIFDVVIFSNEVHLAKPHKEIFMLCLKKLGLKAEECVFIDDQSNNIAAAEELGFNTIQFENAAQLKKSLKGIGVEP